MADINLTNEGGGGTTQIVSGGGGLAKTSNTNPSFGYELKKDDLWLNHNTGEVFACVDDSGDLNRWVGQISGEAGEEHTYNYVDAYNDGSCVAVYPMDGNSTDLSGNYNGTDTGMSYEDGIIEECAYFDGDGYIEIPTEMADVFDKEITITAWVKLTENSDSEKIIFNAGANIAEVRYKNNTIGVAFGDDWSWNNVQDVEDFDTFHFFAMTYNKESGDFKLYLDNEKIFSDTNEGDKAILNPNDRLGIGARYDNNDEGNPEFKFIGYIDHARVYNRVLSSYELGFLYSGAKFIDSVLGKVDIFGDGSAVALYQMDGDATDTGGNYDGATTDITYDIGKFGDAGAFNGDSSKIANTELQPDSDFTVSLWIKFNALSTWAQSFSLYNGTDQISFVCDKAKFTASLAQDTRKEYSYKSVETDTWYHIVYGTDDTFYFDNVKTDRTDTKLGNYKYAPDEDGLLLGVSPNYDDYWLDGQLDQIRIFNRILTADEVDVLYNEE